MCKRARNRLLARCYNAMASYVLSAPHLPAHTNMISINLSHSTTLQHVEPGPDDEPGPHYESYGSSFGNFGPLPPDSAFGEVRIRILHCD
jgi:hypothetical protein